VYDNDLEDIDEVGWDRFVAGIWESIFVGYRTSGIRTIGRRWSDLLQAGLGCSQELADLLVRNQVLLRMDRDLIAVRDPEELVTEMHQIVADVGADLAELTELRPADRAGLLAAHTRLRTFLRDGVLELADDQDSEYDEGRDEA
jgi:hypothetical protein